MLKNLNILCVIGWLLAGFTVGRNGCRQCGGKQSIYFTRAAAPLEAYAFFQSSLGRCATGNQYQVDVIVPDDCDSLLCKSYVFYLKIWRYCGNGGTVDLKRTDHCIAGLCAATDDLNLSCRNSVDCKGTCNCAQCGC